MQKTARLLALAGISLLSFTGFLDATIVSTALPAIQISLHMTMTELQWVMNAFFLGISAFMASMGKIADIYGRRKVFYIGTIVFGLASLGAGFSTNPSWLIFFRAIQGIMTAITIPVAIALIQSMFEQSEIAKAMSIFAMITGLGLALGPVAGGILVTSFGWPSVFLVNIPFVVLGFGLCLASVKESRSQIKMSLDYFGIIFLVLTTSALVFAVVEANTYGWHSPLIIGSFIVFAVSLILLIITESKVAFPIMSGALFKNRIFTSSLLFSFAGGGLMSVILFIDPLYLHLILHKSIFMTGLFLFIMPLIVITASPVIGQINAVKGPRWMMVFGSIFFIIAALGHSFLGMSVCYWLLIPSFLFFGLGWAITNQSPAVALGQSIDQDHLSVAMGALFTFYNIGSAVMLAGGVTLFQKNAMASLVNYFSTQHVQIDQKIRLLLQEFVMQPDHMPQILQQLQFLHFNIEADFKYAFMSGMHAMFWPLLGLSIIAFVAVTWFMKGKN